MEYQRTEKDLTEVIRSAKLDAKSITRISQVIKFTSRRKCFEVYSLSLGNLLPRPVDK